MLFWTQVEQVVNDVDVEYPSLPRKRTQNGTTPDRAEVILLHLYKMTIVPYSLKR